MNFIARIKKKFSTSKNCFMEADAIVLSINSPNKLLIQVLPAKERNFVVEVLNLSIQSLHPGQRVRVKYDPVHHCKVEITGLSI